MARSWWKAMHRRRDDALSQPDTALGGMREAEPESDWISGVPVAAATTSRFTDTRQRTQGTMGRPSTGAWPWMLAALAALAVFVGLRSTAPDEASLGRYRTVAESQLPAPPPSAPRRDVATQLPAPRPPMARMDATAAQPAAAGMSAPRASALPIDPEAARAAVRGIAGVRSVTWLARDVLLVRVATPAQRGEAMFDTVCAALSALGNTPVVAVRLQDTGPRAASGTSTYACGPAGHSR